MKFEIDNRELASIAAGVLAGAFVARQYTVIRMTVKLATKDNTRLVKLYEQLDVAYNRVDKLQDDLEESDRTIDRLETELAKLREED